MKYSCLTVWSKTEQEIEQFTRDAENNSADKYINFCQDEFNFWEEPFFDRAYQALRSHNRTFINVVCTHNYFCEYPKENIEIQYWDTYYLSKTYNSLFWNDQINSICNNDYDHYFISMNRKVYEWRKHLLDLMALKDIIKLGAVSWHDVRCCDSYKFKYFHGQKMYLDSDYQKDGNQYKLPTKQYSRSFFQIVGESTTSATVMSEKTATPLILGKPFLVSSVPFYHKFLKKLGFELYDEVFDYSFDNELDQETRFLKLLSNVDELTKYPLHQLPDLYKKISDKVEYNKQLAKKIAFDVERFPPVIKETISLYKETGCRLSNDTLNLYDSLNKIIERSRAASALTFSNNLPHIPQ